MLLLAAMACRVVDTCVELADLLSVVAVQVSIHLQFARSWALDRSGEVETGATRRQRCSV